MDLLEIAQSGFRPVDAALKEGLTPEVSDAAERWLRAEVAPVAERLCGLRRFRDFAAWSLTRLPLRSESPQRPLVDAVDGALVETAKLVVDSELALGLSADLDPPEPGTPPGMPGPSVVRWIAGRPRPDLVIPDDYFQGPGGLGGGARPEWHRDFCETSLAAVPALGDHVCRGLFARLDWLCRKTVEAWSRCLFEASDRANNDASQLELVRRLVLSKGALDEAVAALRAACHVEGESRLRDACCVLAQVATVYGTGPRLGWLGYVGATPNVIGPYCRSARILAPADLIEAEPDGEGGLRVIDRQRALPVRPEAIRQVAASLDVVTSIYRTPVEREELIDWLRVEHRLVLADGRPRAAYWKGGEVRAEWDRNPTLWDLLWRLGDAARREEPVDREAAVGPGRSPRTLTYRRHKLGKLLPDELNALIEDVPPGGYVLRLPAGEVALVPAGDDLEPVEAGLDVLRPVSSAGRKTRDT